MIARRRSAKGSWLLRSVARIAGECPLRLTLESGETCATRDGPAVATVRFRDRATLLKVVLEPEIAFGEEYARGNIEVEGDLVALLESVYRSWRYGPSGWLGRLAARWLRWRYANSLRGSRKNIHRHYDLGTDFFEQWLDSQMVYSCAYFPSPETMLEEAQTAKMELICRKLDLQPGERVIETGCGWGALALHMAREHGVRVQAFNISRDQIAYARRRAVEEGLADRVEFIEDDYRNATGRFDVFVSIGMLEHVGTSHYPDLARVMHDTIGDRGRGLLHFIGRNQPSELSLWIQARIFPGAHVPTLSEAARLLEPWDYSVLDVENLRLHYAMTLLHWLERFERSWAACARTHDKEFLRAWRLYLAGSVVAFRVGTLQLFQVLFAGRDCERIRLTRDHLYGGAAPVEPKQLWTSATF